MIKLMRNVALVGKSKKEKISSTGNFLAHHKLKHKDTFGKLREYLKKSNNSNSPSVEKKVLQPTINEMYQNTSAEVVCNRFVQ